MKIIEVLKELPLIQKRIEKNNLRIGKYCAVVDTGEPEDYVIGSKALSANKGLIEWESVKKWNGVLPYMMGQTATPFINLDRK